ncbi:hypothetical protein tb265_02620 [Gemmatimonadetes bacterium T265]|nr:hypothetical protein tb265_02620 [Gemmatimonadetes bacterium T265]
MVGRALPALGLVLAAARAGDAQVQVTIYNTYPSTAPSPTQAYPGGTVLCSATAFGTATGFSIDFSSAAAVDALCGAGASSRINNYQSFGARFTGFLVAPTTASNYALTVNTDDGDVLTIDGVTYDSDWITKAYGPGYVGNIPLTAGNNPFTLDYFQGPPVQAYANFSVQGATVIPPPPTTAPEPATVVLVAAGLAGAGVAARRRRA